MATDLERLSVLIEANTKSYERAMVRLQSQTDKALRGASRSVAGLDAALSRATGAARSFASVLGAGLLVGGLAQLPGAIRDMVKEVADLGDQADRIGITAERLQELNFQAEQTGSSAEAMAAGLEQFSKRLGEARTGSGELYKLLRANGLALDEIASMSVNEALEVFVDLLGNASDQADRLKIAAIGGGKAAADWALTFAGGSQATLEFALQARAASVVISGDLVKSAQDIDDEFSQLTTTISTMIKSGLLEYIRQAQIEISALGGVLEDLRTSAEEGARAAGRRTGELIAHGPPQTSDVANDRISQAFEAAGEEAAKARMRRTRLPPASGGGAAGHRAATRAVKEHKDAVVELIAELQRELSLVGASDTAQRVSNELHRAGADATAAQKQQIAALVTAIEAEEQAQQALIDKLDTLRDTAGSALDSFVQSIAAGEGPLKSLKAALDDVLQSILRIAEQRLILSLFGAAGTTGGGFLAPIFGGLTGAAKAPSVVQVNVVPGQMFEPVVQKISGNVAVQHVAASERRMPRVVAAHLAEQQRAYG